MTTETGSSHSRHLGPPPPAPSHGEAADGDDGVHAARLWALAMAAAILSGLLTWMIGERTVGYFEPS